MSEPAALWPLLAPLIAPLLGGLGLLLLGMDMMSDGLKLAAGSALRRILAGATRTRRQALASGVLITALVQSSSAVTVAVIGFVNAGLLGLSPALWVLFGANVGTTMTGWIVALVGLKFKIEALALPLVGIGVLLRLTGAGHQRRRALGTALAGFGLLFLGIAMLQQAFAGLPGQLSLPQGEGALAVLAQLGVGALMTVLMQSSSAAMVVALTAAEGGLIGTAGAAAVVIGTNIGTTVTALLASLGATPNARRVAAAHVVFNLLTGLVALLLLPWLIDLLIHARQWLHLPLGPAALLAMFHTSFNLLGVLLMWPLADGLARWLGRRFRAREEDEAQPRYLDDNVLAVPALALDALQREVARAGQLAAGLARQVLAGAEARSLARQQAVVVRLDEAIETFVERMNRSAMTAHGSQRLAQLLRLQRYHETVAEQALTGSPLPSLAADSPLLALAHAAFVRHCDALLARIDGVAGANEVAAMENSYQALKAALLAAGADGTQRLAEMETRLRHASALRRATQQWIKSRQWTAAELQA